MKWWSDSPTHSCSLLSSPRQQPPRSLQEEQMVPIAEIVKKEIQAGKIPGAVILIGNQGKVVYRRAFGLRALKPKKVPMTIDTIFDIASLTKVIATSTAVAQLVEMGKLNLEDPVAKYWPEFKVNGKEAITVRDLLHALFRSSAGSRPEAKWVGLRHRSPYG